jgi:hypothetical protein
MGTPDFVAPEALMFGAAIDGRADIYALGVMLYQMLVGQIPRGAWQPASVLSPGTDRRFDQIILKAMQYDRENRYPSCAHLRRDLDVILTVPLVKADAPAAAVVPAAQAAQIPGQRTAAPKPMGKPPMPKSKADSSAGKGIPEAASVPKSKLPLFIGLGAVAALSIGTFIMLGGKQKPVAASRPPPAAAPPVASPKKVVPPPSKPSSTSTVTKIHLTASKEAWVDAMKNSDLLKVAVKEGSSLRMTDACKRVDIALSPSGKDGAVRMLFTADESTVPLCTLNVRHKPSSTYKLHMEPNLIHVGLGIYEKGASRTLRAFRLPPEMQPARNQPLELELRVIGTTLSAKVNGVEVISLEDKAIAQGDFGIQLAPGVLLHAVQTLDLSKKPLHYQSSRRTVWRVRSTCSPWWM